MEPKFYSQPSLPYIPSLPSQSQLYPSHHQCISTLQGHSSSVFSLALDGNFLYSGSSNKEIRIWNHDEAHNNVIRIGEGAVKSIVIAGEKVFSAHQDNKIRVWEINHDSSRYKRMATLPTLGDRVMKLFPATNYVKVRRHKKCTWVHHIDVVSALALSVDESLIYSASWDRTFKIWRTSDYKCLESINAHDDAINAIAVSKTGFIYTGSADKKIKIWRKSPGDKKHSLIDTLEKHQSGINALVLSSDGCVLYSGACDHSILVWENDGGGAHMVVVGALRGHTKAILCLALVKDLVCSGSADKTVRIWRRGVGRSYSCLAVLEGHNGPVKCLAGVENYDSSNSSSSNYLVYSGSLDCDIKVWQITVPLLT